MGSWPTVRPGRGWRLLDTVCGQPGLGGRARTSPPRRRVRKRSPTGLEEGRPTVWLLLQKESLHLPRDRAEPQPLLPPEHTGCLCAFGPLSPEPSPALPDLPVMDVPGVDTAEDFTSSMPMACGGSPLLDALTGAERLPQETSVGLEVCDGATWLLWESQSTEPKLEVGFWPPGRLEEGGMPGRWAQLWIRLRTEDGGRAQGLQRDRRQGLALFGRGRAKLGGSTGSASGLAGLGSIYSSGGGGDGKRICMDN